MKIQLEDLTKAMQKVKSFADGASQVPGVLLDIKGNNMAICYADNRKAIIETIGVVHEENDIEGKIVVAYNRLVGIIDMCQPSGEIKTGEMSITFLEGNIMNIEATKYMTVLKSTDDVDENGDTIEVEESKVVSKFNQKINFEYPEDNVKYGILTRMNYQDIFKNEAGEEGIEGFDVWDKEELRAILSKISTEKGKTVYISKQLGCGFVINLAHVVYIPNDNCDNYGFSTNTAVARALVDILGKMPDTEVRICVKDRYTNIINGTDTVGIWFEMAPASKMDMGALKIYTEKEFSTFRLVFSRAALSNVVSCASASTKEEKTTLQFEEIDGLKSLKIVSNNTGASISGDFTVVIEGKQIDNWDELVNTKIPMSLKVLSDMLADCSTTYISFDIDIDEKGKFIRLAEAKGKDENGNVEFGTIHYTVADK